MRCADNSNPMEDMRNPIIRRGEVWEKGKRTTKTEKEKYERNEKEEECRDQNVGSSK